MGDISVRWKFTDCRTGVTYAFRVNPNDGGSPGVTKTVTVNNPIGPGRWGLMSEGRIAVTPQEFSGSILDQAQYEAMEGWALRRTLLQVEDDLERTFQGVLTSWNPKRVRRAFNFWYHTYTATVTLSAMANASGQVLFGRLVTPGV